MSGRGLPKGDADYGKDYLVDEIAKRAKFTKGDVRVILKTFEDIIVEMIKNKKSFVYNHMFRITIREIKSFIIYDHKRKKYWKKPVTWRLFMSPSPWLAEQFHKAIGQNKMQDGLTDADFKDHKEDFL